ncbi:MAG: glycine cleavage system protein R [Gammaproteobacteria bacterium CG22_combo_CG10-13_8_21_14_all_40_8]|nr:MAG: glycine cleavage system protein R [Gammaproteobacteria bacterium CG22_combo_CG10-13_8_21_14_all_40_8]
MSSYLVVSALGENRPGLVNELSDVASKVGCSIVDSRMTVLGNEFGILMLLTGEWNALAKMEHQLPLLANRLGLTTMIKRTTQTKKETDKLPYQIQVIARDNQGIIRDISHFFYQLNMDIIDIHSDTYPAPHTGAPMVELNLLVNLPTSVLIADIRELFSQFCDEENLDASMDPLRH